MTLCKHNSMLRLALTYCWGWWECSRSWSWRRNGRNLVFQRTILSSTVFSPDWFKLNVWQRAGDLDKLIPRCLLSPSFEKKSLCVKAQKTSRYAWLRMALSFLLEKPNEYELQLTEGTTLLKHNTIRTSKKRTVFFPITCYFCRSSLIALVIQIRCLTLFIKGSVDEQSYVKLLEFCVKFGQMFRIYTQEFCLKCVCLIGLFVTPKETKTTTTTEDNIYKHYQFMTFKHFLLIILWFLLNGKWKSTESS